MKKLIPLLLGGTCVLASCGTGSSTKTETTAQAPEPGAAAPDSSGFNIVIAPVPPQDLDPGNDPKKLAEFAWAEFFALNWQSSYPKNQLRDSADLGWNFSSPDATLAVWETYAHRTELRPNATTLQPFDAAPHYSFGKMPKPVPGSKAVFTLFNNLDENNEIGSCNLYGQVNQPGGNQMVLYQAKVNRVEYDYIRNTFSGDTTKLYAAGARTAANIAKYKAYYKGATSSCNCPADSGVLCLPCGNLSTKQQGAMEIKTAWRMLTPADDTSKFFTRTVIYYRQPNGTGPVYYHNAVFALIGMHIIHKTTNYPDFVFATWEHIDVEKDHMGLTILKTVNKKTVEVPPYRKAYQRQHPIAPLTMQATRAAHAKLRQLNPNSVWLNYQLTGVQGTPTSDSTSANYFLANYVVESDTVLQNFHGSGIGTPFNLQPNILSQGQSLTMGGCQGCHGVSQQGGTDFSFLLDNFQKPVKSPDVDQTMQNKLGRRIRFEAKQAAAVRKAARP